VNRCRISAATLAISLLAAGARAQGPPAQPPQPLQPGSEAQPIQPDPPPQPLPPQPPQPPSGVDLATRATDSASGLSRVPGALYGGSPEGASAAIAVPGSINGQAVVAIDGFEIAGAPRAGAAGFGLLAEEEVQVTPSGVETDAAAPGVRINLVQKRGTNEWRGSGSALWGGTLAGGRDTVSTAAVPAAQVQSGEPLTGNRLRGSNAYGLEAGGPLRQDRLWLWATLDRTAQRWTAFGGQPSDDALRRAAGKLNAQPAGGNSAVLAWNGSWQRAAGEGAGPERAPSTTLDGRSRSNLARLEDTQVLSAALYWTATLGATDFRATDDPRAGLGRELWFDTAGVAHGSWFALGQRRRRQSAAFSGERFFTTGKLNHEVKLGGEGRHESGDTDVTPAGSGAVLTPGEVVDLPPDFSVIQAWREGRIASGLERESAWLQDKITWGPATVLAGLRYDLQRLVPHPSRVAASPFTPLLPALDFSGTGNASARLRWQSSSPRLAFTWAMGKNRQTLLRASLSRYAEQLDAGLAAQLDPTAPASAYFYWFDPEHHVVPPPSAAGLRFWVPTGFDPAHPGVTPNAVDPALHPEQTDEAVLGVELAPLPGSVLTLTGTYRRTSGVLEERLFVRDSATGQVRLAESGDWVPAGAVSGQLASVTYYQPYYDLRQGLTPTGGTLLTNGDRRQRYAGLTLGWTRRLADRWMARAHLTWQDWTWQIGPNFTRFADPTEIVGQGQRNGAPVAEPAAGFGDKPFFLSSRWSFNASALVQLPWAVSATVDLDGRQGFPVPYFQQVSRDAAGPVDVQATDRLDAFRYGNLFTVDARLEREVALRSELDLTLSLEGLNLIGAGTVLRREADLGVTRAGYLNEILAARTFRLGLKLAFR
jgi:hypothetical protein